MKYLYIGIKYVEASPMTAEEAIEHGYRIGDNNGDGYEVIYEEGYKSWCPKEVFEKHNYRYNNKELASTAMLMVSSDYKERFIAEYKQLDNRYKALKAMVAKWDYGKLDFTPTCPRSIYNIQLEAMDKYRDVLISRAQLEGVDLGIPDAE
jgi:hypothetical protein